MRKADMEARSVSHESYHATTEGKRWLRAAAARAGTSSSDCGGSSAQSGPNSDPYSSPATACTSARVESGSQYEHMGVRAGVFVRDDIAHLSDNPLVEKRL